MANEFHYYDDDTAERFGPVSKEQLQSFAQNGAISRNTIIESSSGQQGKASQLSWLTFPTPTPPPPYLPPPSGHGADSPFEPKRSDATGFPAAGTSAAGFLDIMFTRFITKILIPIIWCVGIVLAVLSVGCCFLLGVGLGKAVDASLVESFGAGFVLLIIAAVAGVFFLLWLRIFLEAIMVVFRIEKHLRKMSGD